MNEIVFFWAFFNIFVDLMSIETILVANHDIFDEFLKVSHFPGFRQEIVSIFSMTHMIFSDILQECPIFPKIWCSNFLISKFPSRNCSYLVELSAGKPFFMSFFQIKSILFSFPPKKRISFT